MEADGIISGSGLFKWDTGLIRDGCFIAAFLMAGGEGELNPWPAEGGMAYVEQEEGVEICLRALHEMRWCFSKTEERDHTVRMVWDVNTARDRRSTATAPAPRDYHHSPEVDGPYSHPQGTYEHTMPLASLPPSISSNPRPTRSSGGGTGPQTWTYTPPGSAHSMSNSSSTGQGSPGYSAYSGQGPALSASGGGEGDYYVTSEMDTFTYSVPVSDGGGGVSSDPSSATAYGLRHDHERHSSSSSTSMHAGLGGAPGHGGYLDPSVVFAGSAATPVAADCHGYYQ
jgi:hypothetical protein